MELTLWLESGLLRLLGSTDTLVLRPSCVKSITCCSEFRPLLFILGMESPGDRVWEVVRFFLITGSRTQEVWGGSFAWTSWSFNSWTDMETKGRFDWVNWDISIPIPRDPILSGVIDLRNSAFPTNVVFWSSDSLLLRNPAKISPRAMSTAIWTDFTQLTTSSWILSWDNLVFSVQKNWFIHLVLLGPNSETIAMSSSPPFTETWAWGTFLSTVTLILFFLKIHNIMHLP